MAAYVRVCARLLAYRGTVRSRYWADMAPNTWALCESGEVVDSVEFVWGPRLARCRSPKAWRLTVAHELLHAHLVALRGPIESWGKEHGELGWSRWYDHAEEEIVERLEAPVAKLLPDPSFLA